MRKDSNMMLRGATWYLRIAVPKSLQTIRAEQGNRSSKELWRSLETGDYKTAKAKAVQLKADVLRAFAEEELRHLHRPVPTLEQVQDAAEAFRLLVRSSLANERLLELPSGRDVALATVEQAELGRALDDDDLPTAELDRKRTRYFDLDWVITAHEQMHEARAALRQRLWDDLGRLDHVNVDPFIQEVARYRGYRIDSDSVVYRQLGHLLLKGWIQELDEADARFMDPAMLLEDQSSVLASWSRPKSGPNDAPAPRAAPAFRTQPAEDIRQFFDRYLAERFAGASESSLLERRRTIQQFVEVVGLKPLGHYRKGDMSAFKAALLKLPINAARDYPGKTALEVIEKAPASAQCLAPKTVKLRLSIMGSFGKWLSENVDGIDPASFKTSAPKAESKGRKVREFTDSEVRTIFTCPTFTGCESERNQSAPGDYRVRGYRFWLPLMAAFTGCRLNELTQLRLNDVVDLDGGPVLRITDQGEGQSLKTRASERLVPVHSQLLAAGFIGWVDQTRKAGHEVLFHDIPIDRNGRRSEAAGKRFRKFLTRLGIKESGVRGGLHRFRHTVIEKLRAAGNSDYEIALIVGHDTNMAKMTSGYGSSRQMLVVQRRVVLESLMYEGLTFEGFR